MFFERRTQSSIRHRRFHYLLLLSLRLALLLLLALAFANPYLKRTAVATAGDKQLLLVVDNSFSMRAGKRLADAKREALSVLAVSQRIHSGAGGGSRFTTPDFDAARSRFRRAAGGGRKYRSRRLPLEFCRAFPCGSLHFGKRACTCRASSFQRHAEIVDARRFRGAVLAARRNAGASTGCDRHSAKLGRRIRSGPGTRLGHQKGARRRYHRGVSDPRRDAHGFAAHQRQKGRQPECRSPCRRASQP